MRGGRTRHEKSCTGQAAPSGLGALNHPEEQPLSPGNLTLGLDLPDPPPMQAGGNAVGADIPERQCRSTFRIPTVEEIQDIDAPAHSDAHEDQDSDSNTTETIHHESAWDNVSNVPNPMQEGQVWIRRHPCANLPSGFQNEVPLLPLQPTQTQSAQSRLPPYHPFPSLDDFEQAQIFIKNGASDGQITEQLQHNARRYGLQGSNSSRTPKNAKELHQILARANTAESLMFESHTLVTEYKGYTYKHVVRVRSLWLITTELLMDPDLTTSFVYMPEQRFIRNPHSESGEPMMVLEEVWHSKDWWDMQLRIGPDGFIVFIQLYVDSTHLTTIGDVKVWPVYMWLGNLPAALRKRRGKGGAALVAYLPFVNELKELSKSSLAELRAQVYQEAFAYILQTIQRTSQHGKLVRCSDGIVRNFIPLIGSISVDYEELMRILSLLGHQSGFPCPICLVPRDNQGDLSGTQWPRRTYSGTLEVLAQAAEAAKSSEAKAIRQTQSLRKTTSTALLIMGPEFSVYDAVAHADPLHQIEQGIFGKHLWPKITSIIGRTNCAILDQRFKNIPVYPDLKHFPNGVTSLKFIEGHEHATILRLLAPLVEDLLPRSYKKVSLKAIRTLACIHMLSKFTSHTDRTLGMLNARVIEFGSYWKQFSSYFESEPKSEDRVSSSFPKLHSLLHLVDTIYRKSTTDNYHTGLGEAQHPQSKSDYDHTNHRPGFEDQLLRLYRERETMKRIEANITRDSQARLLSAELASAAESSPRVELGSVQHRVLTSTFIESFSFPAPSFQQQLQVFLYENVVLGREAIRIPSTRNLPSLQGTYVIPYRLLRVAYVSLLDSSDGLDVMRVTPSWYGAGPRYDFAIIQDAEEHVLPWFAQILSVFVLDFNGVRYRLAYVRRFRTRHHRSKSTDYIELKDQNEFSFIFVDSIVRSCVVMSPGVHSSRLVVGDLNDADMYLRLLEIM